MLSHRAFLFELSVVVGPRTHLYFLFSAATKKKRLPAASAHFTLFCFSQF